MSSAAGSIRNEVLPMRMNALWFTYSVIFLFALLPNWGIYLGAWEVFGYSLLATMLVNLWSMYRDTPVMDERKQEVATEAMAWAFVSVSVLMVPMATTGVEIDASLVRDTASMGLWTWLIFFSVKNLLHKYGGGGSE